MRLIFIYGPPASGKLTVGTKLAEQTAFTLFHNHITVPVARVLFPGAHEPHHGEAYSQLLKELRLAVIRSAAKEDVSLIFTFAYSGAVDDAFVADIVKAVADREGTVHFVQLHAPDDVLFERVTHESRHKLGKMTDPEHLRAVLASRDMRASVQHPEVLRLDTSEISPTDAAQRIIGQFDLLRSS